MDDAMLADLDNLREFFDRVDKASSSTVPADSFHTEQKIDIKDFIEWCNLCEAQSKYSSGDSGAKALGNAVVSLNQLDRSELDAMESALKEGGWTEYGKKASEDDATFYLVLKHHTDDQQHYHFHFDKDMVAEIDAFDPFTKEGGKQVLNQQWHALISVLALYDVAHALSNEQHEYHCLYQYIKKWDMGDLSALHLQLLCSPSQPENKRIKLQLVKPKTTTTKAETKTFRSEKMNEWLIGALRRLASK